MKTIMIIAAVCALGACEQAKTPAEMTPVEREAARAGALKDQAAEVYDSADDRADRLDAEARRLARQSARMADEADRIRADGRTAQERIEAGPAN